MIEILEVFFIVKYWIEALVEYKGPGDPTKLIISRVHNAYYLFLFYLDI